MRSRSLVALAAALAMIVTPSPALASTADPDGQDVGTHRLVSKRWDGSPTTSSSTAPAANGNGRHVVFTSTDNHLIEGETLGGWQVYLRDVKARTTKLISRSIDGRGGAGDSYDPMISRDGTRVVYWSEADDLVPADRNRMSDVFLFDTTTGETTLVSRTPAGRSGNGYSVSPVISANGRWIAFGSAAGNLVPGVDGPRWDVFLLDTHDLELTVLSLDPAGEPVYGDSNLPSISADGRYVSFWSHAQNLVPDDLNFETDIFVRDVKLGQTSIASVSSSDSQTDAASDVSAISPDGRYVAFETRATNLGYPDGNEMPDVYVRDLQAGTTRLASRTATGRAGDRDSGEAVAGSDGRVYFEASASDLVEGDDNGKADIFAFDNATEEVVKITFDRRGRGTNGHSSRPALSWSGQRLVYDSAASDITRDIEYVDYDVFVYRDF